MIRYSDGGVLVSRAEFSRGGRRQRLQDVQVLFRYYHDTLIFLRKYIILILLIRVEMEIMWVPGYKAWTVQISTFPRRCLISIGAMPSFLKFECLKQNII